MTDWDEALSAAKNPMQDDCGVLSHKKQKCLIAALTKGQAAEAALERAIEKLAGTDHCFHPQWGAEHCENQVDCEACWREYLTKEAE